MTRLLVHLLVDRLSCVGRRNHKIYFPRLLFTASSIANPLELLLPTYAQIERPWTAYILDESFCSATSRRIPVTYPILKFLSILLDSCIHLQNSDSVVCKSASRCHSSSYAEHFQFIFPKFADCMTVHLPEFREKCSRSSAAVLVAVMELVPTLLEHAALVSAQPCPRMLSCNLSILSSVSKCTCV